MNSGDCTVTLGDKTIKFKVKDFTIQTDFEHYDSYSPYFRDNYVSRPISQTIQLEGYVQEILLNVIGDKNMGYCDDSVAAKDSYDGNSLSKKYANLELDGDDRLLREHGIVSLDGTLTEKGKDFVMNVLFSDYKNAVVEALDSIDAHEKSKES